MIPRAKHATERTMLKTKLPLGNFSFAVFFMVAGGAIATYKGLQRGNYLGLSLGLGFLILGIGRSLRQEWARLFGMIFLGGWTCYFGYDFFAHGFAWRPGLYTIVFGSLAYD